MGGGRVMCGFFRVASWFMSLARNLRHGKTAPLWILTLAALRAGGRAKSKFLSVIQEGLQMLRVEFPVIYQLRQHFQRLGAQVVLDVLNLLFDGLRIQVEQTK